MKKGGYPPRIPIDDLIAKYRELGSVRAVALYYRYTTQVVTGRLRRAGVEIHYEHFQRSASTDEVITLFRSGVNPRHISRQLGISDAAVRSKLMRAGLLHPKPIRKSDHGVPDETLLATYREIGTVKGTAERLGLRSRTSLSRRLKRLGVVVGSPSKQG